MRRAVLVLVFILAAASGATAIFFYRENCALRDELAALRARSATMAVAQAEATAPPTTASTNAMEASTAAVLPPAPAPATTPARARAGSRREGDGRDRGQEFLAEALADPESRAAMLSRAKSQIDRMFGDYFVKLGLNETQIEALRTLLAERQMARMESGMLERTAGTEQERTEAQTFRDARLATTEADINTILGADGLKNLQAYLDSAPQRQVVDDIARRATYAGAPLSSEASDRLLAAVRQAADDIPLPQLPGPGRWGGGEGNNSRQQPVTAETVTTYMQDLRARNQQIIDRSRDFLSQPQLEALADQQIDAMQQTEAQLNFMVRNPDARGPGAGFGGGGPGGGGGRRPGG